MRIARCGAHGPVRERGGQGGGGGVACLVVVAAALAHPRVRTAAAYARAARAAVLARSILRSMVIAVLEQGSGVLGSFVRQK